MGAVRLFSNSDVHISEPADVLPRFLANQTADDTAAANMAVNMAANMAGPGGRIRV